MENNKTAVDWLFHQLWDEPKDKFTWYAILKEAKEMEKQQKMQCWEAAHQAGRFEGKGIAEENWQTFEQHYNEEYGK